MTNYKVTGCHFVVPVEVYSRDVLFMFGYNRKRIIRLLSESEEPNVREILKYFKGYKESYKGLCIIGDHGQVFITMPVIPTTSEDFGTLVHEIFHGVEGVMSYVGNEHRTDDVDESWAYLIGYLTTQVFRNLNQYYPD